MANSRWIVLTLQLLLQSAKSWYDGPCGESPYTDAGTWPDSTNFIVGGIAARPYEFPWQVSLRTAPGTADDHICGGVIIHPYWVLTTSRCLQDIERFTYCRCHVYSCTVEPPKVKPQGTRINTSTNEDVYLTWLPSEVVCVVGEHDKSFPDEGNPDRAYHHVQDMFKHEEYIGFDNNYDKDIALLLLDEVITFDSNVQPVCQPNDTIGDLEKAITQMSGWGTIQWGTSQTPNVLQWTELQVRTNDYCRNLLQQISSRYDMTGHMMCASDTGDHDGRDACTGDYGGPLTMKNANGTFQLVGLSSWGYRCAAGTPGVYTRITSLSDWVTNKLDKNTPTDQ